MVQSTSYPTISFSDAQGADASFADRDPYSIYQRSDCISTTQMIILIAEYSSTTSLSSCYAVTFCPSPLLMKDGRRCNSMTQAVPAGSISGSQMGGVALHRSQSRVWGPRRSTALSAFEGLLKAPPNPPGAKHGAEMANRASILSQKPRMIKPVKSKQRVQVSSRFPSLLSRGICSP